MEGEDRLCGPVEGALLANQYGIIRDKEATEALVLRTETQPVVFVIPADGDDEKELAHCICQLAIECLGWEGFRERIRYYTRVAATVALVMLALDHNGDGIPDGMDWLLHLGRHVLR